MRLKDTRLCHKKRESGISNQKAGCSGQASNELDAVQTASHCAFQRGGLVAFRIIVCRQQAAGREKQIRLTTSTGAHTKPQGRASADELIEVRAGIFAPPEIQRINEPLIYSSSPRKGFSRQAAKRLLANGSRRDDAQRASTRKAGIQCLV